MNVLVVGELKAPWRKRIAEIMGTGYSFNIFGGQNTQDLGKRIKGESPDFLLYEFGPDHRSSKDRLDFVRDEHPKMPIVCLTYYKVRESDICNNYCACINMMDVNLLSEENESAVRAAFEEAQQLLN